MSKRDFNKGANSVLDIFKELAVKGSDLGYHNIKLKDLLFSVGKLREDYK